MEESAQARGMDKTARPRPARAGRMRRFAPAQLALRRAIAMAIDESMNIFHGPAIGTVNFCCYRNEDYDRVFERLRVMPAGPERGPLFAQLTVLLDAHAPARVLPQVDTVSLIAPRVGGFVLHPCLALPYYLPDVAASGR
jgi:hypothetical protein